MPLACPFIDLGAGCPHPADGGVGQAGQAYRLIGFFT
jgi:hypothetical protein